MHVAKNLLGSVSIWDSLHQNKIRNKHKHIHTQNNDWLEHNRNIFKLLSKVTSVYGFYIKHVIYIFVIRGENVEYIKYPSRWLTTEIRMGVETIKGRAPLFFLSISHPYHKPLFMIDNMVYLGCIWMVKWSKFIELEWSKRLYLLYLNKLES